MPAPLYRYGYGQTVIHILPPPVAGETRGSFSLHSALCGSKRSLYRPQGVYADVARTARVCQRCRAEWARAEVARGEVVLVKAPVKRTIAGPVTRDVQRQRLYSAETYAAPGRTFRSEPEALAYARSLLASDWAQRHFGDVRIREIKFTHGGGAYSHIGRRLITLGYGQRHERTLLHELAHQIVEQSYARSIQAHGPLFARIVHVLFQHKLGASAAGALLEGYRARKVKVASPALIARQGARPTTWRQAMHDGRVPA